MSALDIPIHYPGAKKVAPKRGGARPSARRLPNFPPKGTVHCTDTKSGTGVAVAKNQTTPYNLILDPYTREIIEVLPMNWVAWSLRGYHVSTGEKIETNHAGFYHVQVAIVGYASQMHNLTIEQLDWLAEIFYTLNQLLGIANNWDRAWGEMDNIYPYLSWASSPKRKTLRQNQEFAGWQHHQTWYGNDHWDPGALNADYLKKRIDFLASKSGVVRGGGYDDTARAELLQMVEAAYGEITKRNNDSNSIMELLLESARNVGQPRIPGI